MKTQKKGSIKKVIKKIFSAILIIVLLIALVTVIANVITLKKSVALAKSFDKVEYSDRILPYDKDGYYTFTTDRDFKVMQLTDVHIGGGWMSAKKDAMAINAVAAMVTAEKPDLVIVTGDIAFPVPFQAGTFNNKSASKILATLMESLGVYWVPLYGNHDTEAYSYYNREQLSDFYSGDDLEYCLFKEGEKDVDGFGNSAILIKNSKGIITQSLFIFDSHSYIDGDYFGIMWKYDNMHDNQIEWYKKLVNKFSEYNKNTIAVSYGTTEDTEKAMETFGTVPSLAFYHIPSEEYKLAWDEYCDAGRKDTENVKLYYGTAGESKKVIYCGMHPDNLFETIQELGSTKGIFCGHDHLNNFSLEYKGVRLTYGYSIDYLAYSGIYTKGSQRGCTLINIAPDGTFSCEGSNYYQDKYQTLKGNVKETVTMQDLDAEAKPYEN